MPDKVTTLPDRSQIALEDTWDTASVFATRGDWEAACREISESIPSLEAFQGHLGEGPEKLLAWFDLLQKVSMLMERVMFYAYAAQSVDSTDQSANAMVDASHGLLGRFGAAAAFAEPELMASGLDAIRGWMDSEPRLRTYRHYFSRLEDRQENVREPEVEKILAMAQDPFGTASGIYGMLTNADMRFEPARGSDGVEYEVGQGSIVSLVSNPDREVRRTAWESYNGGYASHKNTLASTLAAKIKQDVFYARARGYGSSLEAALSKEQIPVEVFHNLVSVFRQNLPTWHRYWRIRREALGLDRLHYYDFWAPLVERPPVIPFDQSVEWIAEGMRPLGEEYVAALRRGALEQRWVDRYPNRGKRAGAFSYGVYNTHPFIMMSYSGNITDMSTLAHELGHSLHSYYTWKTQPWIYSDYSIFVAEVASNFNQALVRAHLFETQTDRDFQIALISEAMSNFLRYFFIMPCLARFELETHERAERGEPLTSQSMIELMAGLFEEGFGGEVELDHDTTGMTWAKFGHLYANFYVYQYATGIAGAHALAAGILDGKPGAVENYLNFLRSGGSMYPLDALKMAGVDLTAPEPVEAAFQVLAGVVDRLEMIFSS
jgi:oligoendopeptidase F